jgi:hypothetical protein
MLELFFPFAKLDILKQPFGHTVLHIACMKSSYKCFKFLMSNYYMTSTNNSKINFEDLYGK